MRFSWKRYMLGGLLLAGLTYPLGGCGGGGSAAGGGIDPSAFSITGTIALANGTPSTSTAVELYRTSYTIYSTATVSGKLYSTRNATGTETVALGPLTQTTTTGTNGVYTLTGLPSGNYTIKPKKSGFVFKSVLIPTLDRIGVLTITDSGTVYLYNPEGTGNQLSADGKIIYNTLPIILPGHVLSNQDFEASLPGGT